MHNFVCGGNVISIISYDWMDDEWTCSRSRRISKERKIETTLPISLYKGLGIFCPIMLFLENVYYPECEFRLCCL